MGIDTSAHMSVIKHRKPKRTIILGAGPLALDLLKEIRTGYQHKYRIVGIIAEPAYHGDTFPDSLIYGSFVDLQRVISEVKPDRIIVAMADQLDYLPVNQLLEARISKGIVIEDGQELYEKLTGKIAIESITPASVIFSRAYRPTRINLVLARVLSILLAMSGLIILAPLFIMIPIIIKLDSPGPVFFTQDRVGTGNKRFKLLKFRTMHPDNARMSEWVRDSTHRITNAGKWLRKFRVDELPQFLNVLSGDMSFVGPRPHPASNFELLVLVSRNTPESGWQIPYYSLRSLVRPGITGWAQVRYKYANDINEEIEKIRFDLYYVKHYSIWLDIQILFETFKVVILGRESMETYTDDAKKIEATH